MTNTQTPFDTKVAILSNLYLEYEYEEPDTDLAEFVREHQTIFAMALRIKIGDVIPTEQGIELISRFFDDVCEIQGITEDVAIKDYYEILK
jgi:hypothetical protein